MDLSRINKYNTTALAFLGDSVYEVYVREKLMGSGEIHADRLHKMAVKYVKASAQALVMRRFFSDGFLSEEEEALSRRARNHKSATKPKNADPVDYKLATAFEALIGAVHISGDLEREKELVEKAFEIIEE